MRTAERIELLLKEKLAALWVEVEDDSHLHAGHAGAAGGGGHYSVTVVSERFVGLPLVRQHRLVYEALADQMQGAIHALALKTWTPAAWQAQSSDQA